MIIKKLHIYIIKSFTGPFIATFFITTFILLMQFLWNYIEDLIGKGLNFWLVSKLLIYISASLIPMALPLAILLASLMTFGNLGETYELTAIKSAGVSLQRFMKPLVFITILLCVGAFYFSNNIIPSANLKMRALLYDIQRQKPEFQIKEGIFYSGIEGYSIRIGSKDSKKNMLHDLKIYDHTENRGNVKITIADSGFMKMSDDESKLIITLFSGYNYEEIKEEQNNRNVYSRPHRKDRFEEQQIILDLTGFGLNRTDESLFQSSFKMLNIKQLKYFNDSLSKQLRLRIAEFYTAILKSNYFKSSYNGDTNRYELFSKTEYAPIPLQNDSVFTSLPIEHQRFAVNHAIWFARRVKEHISYSYIDIHNRKKTLRKYNIEWHRKFTLSFACFIFFFIGAPLGAIIRKGGFGMPIVVSVLFFLLYYIITLSGEKMVKELVVTTVGGMWIPSLLFLPFGIFLTYKATTDSVIMNADTYMNFFKKLNIIRFIKKNNRPKKQPNT